MTIFSQTLTNPGGEAGATTGWTLRTGTSFSVRTSFATVSPHTGSYFFKGGEASSSLWDQQISVDPSLEAAIDAGTAAAGGYAWHNGWTGDPDTGALYLECYDSSVTLLDRHENDQTYSATWLQDSVFIKLPVGTRYIRFGTHNERNAFWDDFTLEISDNYAVDYPGRFEPKAHQLGALTWASQTADELYANQLGAQIFGAAETSNGNYEVYAHQLGAYAWVRDNGDRRELRAWRFKQDDNEFYGIQLGASGTLVYNMLSQQWAQWRSPGEVIWRVEDVVDWEGFNLGCDTNTGKIWEIDPEGRLDYGDTPIESIVVGYLTYRFRQNIPCFMAELALSEGQPPSGFADGTVGITLRTSTDDGQSFVNHGIVDGTGIGEDMVARWYSLGLMRSPGMLFEITDSGYARRIDGLDIELSGEPK